MEVTWPQALAWRMRRHQLDPIGSLPVPGVVRRLCGVQAQVASAADLAVRIRRADSRAGEVTRALATGRLIKTWAMRGTLHLLAPEDGGAFLSLIAAGRSWEPRNGRTFEGLSASELGALYDAVRDSLDGAVLTREELITAVTGRRRLRHVGEALASKWGTLLKPLAWQGELCFGPSRGTRVTFTRPDRASTRWAGLPDPEAAAPLAIAAYLGAYGPATVDAFTSWLGAGRRRLRRSFTEMGDRLAEVKVDGAHAYVLAEDADELAVTKPTRAVRLLGAFDQYVLGPGTADVHVVPSARRAAVSTRSGWIQPVVVAGGPVRGTWSVSEDRVHVAWFHESGRPPRGALTDEVARLSAVMGRDLGLAISPS
jgi:DNA glycosylase AlkZ-like